MNESPTIRKTIKAFFYLLPALAVLIVFNLYPIIKSFIMSFYTDYDYFKDEVYARGFDNYQYILQDDEFWRSMYNTLIYVIGVVPISILLSLGIAVMLNQNIRLRGLFRTIYFVPFVTSVVAVSIVWRWIFHTEYGVLNYFLSFIGIDAIEWLTDPQWAMPSLIILAIWKGLGYNIIIFLAGLQNVNKQYYLAAQIDGASKWERFKNITVPLISPTTFFISIISIINAFKVFDEVFALFGGQPGPAGSAQTIVYYIFNRFYGDWDFGVASAAAYMLFLVIFIFTFIQLYVGKKKVNY
ncbi:ABC transporter permease subunit [Agaribacter marinus]|uniref:Sugar ABC transporter permease n=1 Tax=Virgibacillus salarius TaxID=447199 RepID=A0A941DSK6_9BACI|nr:MULTISPECIES: sugar ABC transporter permease [Bacillaceae]MBR7794916.1 sugar ABC transporter permease [Virgibacillus salarius]NAZ07636.1 ABC transporter permease subunit [Agaribacter marinus]